MKGKIGIDIMQIIVTLAIVIITTLFSAYFSGFASKADVDIQFSKIESSFIAGDKENVHKINEVRAETIAKFDKILTAFCILDKKTCTLKER